ncbi:Nitrogen regulatory protein [Candidatus Arsenophonus lipoptenae]|uniref:Nitrogen regulatory protein n=1 Tax=Candidatus Arsenophonus lipoptenae TaxID=634113 RepID=A0A0X9W6U8_9GAMM|nr:PTS IIA-like nitrogen regulatory protein PtsN [Candidatus Arsenophonus lipoptenae]AMA65002.1 Nitrogen regulatory protein [Candidatus Arsenophonus lipoptenae]
MKSEKKFLFSSILTPSCTLNNIHCTSKKRALEIISNVAAIELNISKNIVFNSLKTREKVGTTGIGGGIAIPHGKLNNSNSSDVVGVFLHLEKPIPFDTLDNNFVDLLFAILVPSQKCTIHLHTLPIIAKRLANQDLCRRLRSAKSNKELYEVITE